MTIDDLKNKKVVVLGAGVEGLATLHYLKEHGITAALRDEKVAKQDIAGDYDTYFGEDAFSDLTMFDVAFRSPGIPVTTPKLQHARDDGLIITSQINFFLENCPSEVIGVTGTKGKGTTSSLIYEMLKQQGEEVYLGGNIGVPPFTFLDKLSVHSKVVLELSSFQLHDITTSPHIAVMLMVTSEHLDYHKDTAEYVDAKRNILRFQSTEDFAVINRDYPASNESDIYTNAQVLFVSRERKTGNGCYALDGKILLDKNGKTEEILPIEDVLLPGKHNLENVCAAVMAADLAGVSKTSIVKVLKTFKGLEHRLELVRELNGVRYYDDSFSTTPETAVAAIEAFNNPEILILGGSSKNSDFNELGYMVSTKENIKAVIGIGEEWWRIKEHIRAPKHNMLFIEDAKNMQQVVKAAKALAEPGDVVLLSPACASFGMFKNYKDRGDQFKSEVNNL